MSHALEQLEGLLAAPPRDGVMVTFVAESGQAGEQGVAAGDVILTIDGEPIEELGTLYRALQSSADSEPGHRRIVRWTAAGATIESEFRLGQPLGLQGCLVKQGEAAWEDVPDTDFAPDMRAFAETRITHMRSSFDQVPAGFELVHVRPGADGAIVHVDHLVNFGGDAGEGRTWEYRTRSRTTHALERTLPTLESHFTLGTEADGPQDFEIRRVGGEWLGERRGHGEEPREIRSPVTDPSAINNYAVPLLCLTMPQREGARLTVTELDETSGRLRARSRLVCEGAREVTVDGSPREACAFGWRHYGKIRAEDPIERFYVSPGRQMLRIDWGPDYGGCQCETVEGLDALRAGLPAHIRLPVDGNFRS